MAKCAECTEVTELIRQLSVQYLESKRRDGMLQSVVGRWSCNHGKPKMTSWFGERMISNLIGVSVWKQESKVCEINPKEASSRMLPDVKGRPSMAMMGTGEGFMETGSLCLRTSVCVRTG